MQPLDLSSKFLGAKTWKTAQKTPEPSARRHPIAKFWRVRGWLVAAEKMVRRAVLDRPNYLDLG